MTYDEQRISDQIDGGLFQQRKEHISAFVKQWMDGHEPDTFVKDDHGCVMYSAKHSTINLTAFFENLIQDYLEENSLNFSLK